MMDLVTTPNIHNILKPFSEVTFFNNGFKTRFFFLGFFFLAANTEGQPLVGVFATNHQPEVLPLYFAARKKNPASRVTPQIYFFL
jgi:hypothetical protein